MGRLQEYVDGFDVNQWKMTAPGIRRLMRNFLRQHGVWVDTTTGKHIAICLAETVKETDPQKWPKEEAEKMAKKKEGFVSTHNPHNDPDVLGSSDGKDSDDEGRRGSSKGKAGGRWKRDSGSTDDDGNSKAVGVIASIDGNYSQNIKNLAKMYLDDNDKYSGDT